MSLEPGVWLTVLNPDGIRSTNYFFAFEGMCYAADLRGAVLRGQIGAHGIYVTAGGADAAGTACPPGTLFAMDPARLAALQAASERQQLEREQRRQQVIEALRGSASLRVGESYTEGWLSDWVPNE